MTVPPDPGIALPPSGDDRDDRALLAAHVAGDSSAFPELVARHRVRLWNLALRTLSSRDEASDALQDAFLRALRGAAGYRGDAEVASWLHRIMLNVCFTRLDARRRRATVPIDDDASGGGHSSELRDARDPFAELDARAAAEHLLARLPTEQRCAIVLVDVEGYSVAAAADLLGVAAGTVKSRCARGRARLAAALRRERETAARETSGDTG
jgi:RNA polymerase sigma-70 factor, ECF subfamily